MNRKGITWVPSLTLILIIALISGCASSGNSKKKTKITQSSSEKTLTLRDFLQKASGVYLTGSKNNTKVMMRSSNSNFNTGQQDYGQSSSRASTRADKQPLFIVDGQQQGRDFNTVANSLSPGEIKSVKVIQGENATLYGSKGYYGVIKITTNRKGK